MPISPATLSAEVPAVVRVFGRRKRNQKATSAPDAAAQRMICAASARPGANSRRIPTPTAPRPNQMMKNAGTANSAIARPNPRTTQCHHSSIGFDLLLVVSGF
jgi:hypothetical protein